MTPPPVTLQISLAPSDHEHALVLLPHQIRAWREEVAEILLTVDFHRSPGRFSARWEAGKDKILPLARSVPGARVVEVDYSPTSSARVADAFFGGVGVPAKDFRGGPFYSYFFGLHAAAHDRVLHIDSDMFFGGPTSGWMETALERMERRPEILVAAPLPGPPAPDHSLRQLRGRRAASPDPAFDFEEMSTRIFLVDRRRFRADFGMLSPRRPALRDCVKALVEGNPPADLPEHLFTRRMREKGLVRHEFAGPGKWHLHPPYRCADFYARLPELVRRCETGDLPAGQLGDHDINDSLVNWNEARERLRRDRWWRRTRPPRR